MKLSIIMPVFNEEIRILEAINQVVNSKYPENKELIIINDGSKDKTAEKIKSVNFSNVKILSHAKNIGKGAAIKTGLEAVTGDIVIIQDADLEYSPDDYPKLIRPIINHEADVVYGTRLDGGEAHRVLFFWHYIANKILTVLSNMFTNLNLTDMEVGSKVFKTEIIRQIKIKEKRFGFEPEVTAKVAKLKCKVYEVPIAYHGRTYKEGKKIGFFDGIRALWCIFKYGIFG